jgi:hypothetical protein
MNKPLWILPTLFLVFLLFNGSAKATLTKFADDKPTISPYECIDENDDNKCDNEPED